MGECDGSPEYTVDECDKTDRGTEIILHISGDSEEISGRKPHPRTA
jgi:molecular chaperone HtpG